MGLSNGGRLTTLRLFHDYPPGETTTIGYDYSSRDATTIADLYWLSGESPKRDTAASRQWFRPPCQEKGIMPYVCQVNARLTIC